MADLAEWGDKLSVYWKVLRDRAAKIRRSPQLQARVEQSDLVQETMKRAVESPSPCRGKSDKERLAWLFKIQDRVVIDTYREHHAACRDVNRERALRRELDDSTAEYLNKLPDGEASPSEQVAERDREDREQSRLAAAIARLPEGQREVVTLIVIERKTPAEAAAQLGKSEGSVAGLYHRGIKAVTEMLAAPEER